MTSLSGLSWHPAVDFDGKRGFKISLAIHALAAAAAVIFFWSPRNEEPGKASAPAIKTFNVQGIRTPLPERPVLAALPPTTSKSPIVVQVSDAPSAAIALPDGGSGSGIMIWTPPQPGRTYDTGGTENSGAPVPERVIVSIPLITLPGDAIPVAPAQIDVDAYQVAVKAFRDRIASRLKVGSQAFRISIDESGKAIRCGPVDSANPELVATFGCNMLMAYSYAPRVGPDAKPQKVELIQTLDWSPDEVRISSDNVVIVQKVDGEILIFDKSKLDQVDSDSETIGSVIDPSGD